jgi:drug/metabolite transporter (DMT)-like permease
MLFVCLLWGANFTITKLAFSQLPPLAFTAVRFAAGSVLLFFTVRFVEGRGPVPRGPLLWRLVWLGLFGNTLYQLGFVLGLAHSTATNTSLIIATAPAVVAILGGLLGVEKPGPRGLMGIVLAIAGVAMVVLARGGSTPEANRGDLFTVGALLCWSIYTVGLRGTEGLSPLQITAWTAYTGTPGLVFAAIPELLRVEWRAVGWTAWAALAYATVLSHIVAYLLWNRSVRAVGGTRSAIYMCVTPVVAVFVAWLALGERPTLLHAIGGAMIAAGVVLTRLDRAISTSGPPSSRSWSGG